MNHLKRLFAILVAISLLFGLISESVVFATYKNNAKQADVEMEENLLDSENATSTDATSTDATSTDAEEDDEIVNPIDPSLVYRHIVGDYNNDNTVAPEEARLALRASVNLEVDLTEVGTFVLDADMNGKITPDDARTILRTSVNLEPIKMFSTDDNGIIVIKDTAKIILDLMGKTVENYDDCILIPVGESADYPSAPLCIEPYSFGGWYSDSVYMNKFDFDKPIVSDVTAYSQWTMAFTSIEDTIGSDESLKDLRSGKSELELHSEDGIISVDVDYTLNHIASNEVIIQPVTDATLEKTAGMVGKPVDITVLNESSIQSAVITFHYDEAKLMEGVSEDNLGILWYDEANNALVLLENAVVDTENNTVSVETSHFSKYMVVDTVAWSASWEFKQIVPRDTGKSLRYNIVICLDDSGSMNQSRITNCENAAKEFVDQLVEGDQVAVLKFSSSASTLVDPIQITGSYSKDFIKDHIKLRGSGGTNFTSAIDKAVSMLYDEESNDDDSTKNYEIFKKLIVLISDGESTARDDVLEKVIEGGFNIVTIGVGSQSGVGELQRIAQKTGGSFFYAATAEDISQMFQQMQGEYIGIRTDSDGDGIPDLVETSGMIDASRYIYHTDPQNPDTDGDGIADGVEMGYYDDEKGYFILSSCPTTPSYTSEKTSVNLAIHFSQPNGYAKSADSYVNRKLTFSITAKGRTTAFDFLSEELPPEAKDITITVTYPNGVTETFHDDYVLAGTTTTRSFTYRASVYGAKGTIKISVSGKNFDTVEKSIDYNFIDEYINAMEALVEKKTTLLQQRGTTVAKTLKKARDDIKIENPFTFDGLGADQVPSDLKQAILDDLASQMKVLSDNYDEALKNTKKTKKFIEKFLGSLDLSSGTKQYKINRVTYNVRMNNFSIAKAVNCFVDISGSNGTIYSGITIQTSQKDVQEVVEKYTTACKELAQDAIKDAINALAQDAASLLGIDQVAALINCKAKSAINGYLASARTGITMEKLEEAYGFYKTAKDAINKAKKAAEKNAAFEDITDSMQAVMALVSYDF